MSETHSTLSPPYNIGYTVGLASTSPTRSRVDHRRAASILLPTGDEEDTKRTSASEAGSGKPPPPPPPPTMIKLWTDVMRTTTTNSKCEGMESYQRFLLYEAHGLNDVQKKNVTRLTDQHFADRAIPEKEWNTPPIDEFCSRSFNGLGSFQDLWNLRLEAMDEDEATNILGRLGTGEVEDEQSNARASGTTCELLRLGRIVKEPFATCVLRA